MCAMKVKFRRGFPPNIDEIRARFPLTGHEIFTYGNKVYSFTKLSKSLVEHEKVHVRQQLAMGPEVWWQRYFDDEEFRFQQELEAHQAEWRAGGDLNAIAERLASPLYGNLTGPIRARELITGDTNAGNSNQEAHPQAD